MRFLDDASDGSIRAGLAEVAPDLVDEPIRHVDRVPDLDPEWFRGTARVGESHFVKYAWSSPAAERIGSEARALELLGRSGIAVPTLVHDPTDLALFVTRYHEGVSLHAFPDAERVEWSGPIAEVMVALHAVPLPRPTAPPAARWVQATADQLREDAFLRFLPTRQHRTVLAWCDWVDGILAASPAHVFTHGDLHGFNMVCSTQGTPTVLFTDFETSGPGEPALDFRYQLSQSDGEAFFEAVVAAYRAAGGVVETDRIAAWTILSVLGDARWRSLAGVGLPFDGTPERWVDDLARQLPGLGAPGSMP